LHYQGSFGLQGAFFGRFIFPRDTITGLEDDVFYSREFVTWQEVLLTNWFGRALDKGKNRSMGSIESFGTYDTMCLWSFFWVTPIVFSLSSSFLERMGAGEVVSFF
jgi:hypothetical protein